MADTCPTCGGPRQSFYVAGYERAEAKQATRVAELEAALRQLLPHTERYAGMNGRSLSLDEPFDASEREVNDAVRAGKDALKPTGRYCTCLHDAPNIRGHDSDCPLATGGKDDA